MVCTAPGVLEARFDEARGLRALDDATPFVRAQVGRFGGPVAKYPERT